MTPLVALRRFCVGWENVGVDFAVGPDKLVTLEAITAIDPTAMRIAGVAAWGLQFAAGHAKNSAAPSSSDAAPETSTMGAQSTEDGPSADTSSTKIPD
jgi:hypothetical protein